MLSLREFTKSFVFRVGFPVAFIAAGTFATIFISLAQMADEANRLEDSLVRRSATAAVQSFVRRLRDSHRDYAVWDDAARALYGPIDADFVDQNIVQSTATPTLFDTAFLLDEEGRDLLAYRNGVKLTEPSAEGLGPALAVLLSGLPRDGKTYAAHAGLLMTKWGLAAVVAGPVVPNTSAFAAPPRRSRTLIIARAMDEAAAKRLGEDFVIDNLRLDENSTGPFVALDDPTGRTIGRVSWSPRHLGTQARAHVDLTVLIMLGLLVAIVAALFAVAARSIREVQRREEQSHYSATHDALTGLPNRTELIRAMRAANDAKSEANTPRVVVYLDLDGFKEVNDAYGHATGDQLLRCVADRFAVLAKGYMLARLAGDEFVVLFTGERAEEIADAFCHRAIESLREPFDLDGRAVVVGTSVGQATADAADIPPDELLRRADVAMYRAKKEGPNRSFTYEAVIDAVRHERIAVANDLRRAIKQNDLMLVYQPIFTAGSRRIVAVEALLRWDRPGKGPMPPSAFIPIAEESGLIEELGAWVLREACGEALAWKDISLSVNVSPAQFRNPNFKETVAGALRETGFPASRLVLEVTETYFMNQTESARAMIDALRATGLSVALDDFGTGFSSIGYLRRFKFDVLKLDRSLLLNILTDDSAQRLVQATIAFANALSLTVVAEGIETEEEAIMLRAAGCHEFQGFLFSKPVMPNEVTALLEALASPARSPEMISA